MNIISLKLELGVQSLLVQLFFTTFTNKLVSDEHSKWMNDSIETIETIETIEFQILLNKYLSMCAAFDIFV